MKRALLCILLEFIDPYHRIPRPRAANKPLVWPTIDPEMIPVKEKA